MIMTANVVGHRSISRHCEERSDAAIQGPKTKEDWIASSQGLLAMTGGDYVDFSEALS